MNKTKSNKLVNDIWKFTEERVSYLEKLQEYPELCFCFYGDIKKETYNKLSPHLLTYFEKNNVVYNYKFKNPELKKFINNSSIHCFQIPYPPLKEIDEDNSIEFWLYDKIENFQKSIRYFEDVIDKKKENKEILKELNKIIKAHKKSIKLKIPKKTCSFRFFIRFTPIKKLNKKSIKTGEFLNIDILNDIFQIIKKFNLSGEGFVCPIFAFDSNKYTLISGISFPFNVIDFFDLDKNSYGKNLIKRFGFPSVDGISISFKDSPIGLEKISSSYISKSNIYIVRLKLCYKTNNPKKMLTETYLAGLNLTNIIMEKK